MLIYHKTVAAFLDDVDTNAIDEIVHALVKDKLRHGVSDAQVRAWKNSLLAMGYLLSRTTDIPSDCGVCIEYQLPNSGKLIDFLLTGRSEDGREHVVIVELKQWETADATEQDGLVITYVGGAKRVVTHPSYQAWSYAALLRNFNATVQDEGIELHPCAYLHNFAEKPELTDSAYSKYVEEAPIFFKGDIAKFRAFVKPYLHSGDTTNIMARIDAGKLRPSKSLADSLETMLGQRESFVLLDEQKVVYEQALQLVRQNEPGKHVLIVEGGPGTGKSVVAINLLVAITALRKGVQYVTKHSAPRKVYGKQLIDKALRREYDGVFGGSESFINSAVDTFDALLVDESHRLIKTGQYRRGENQIKEIINAARVSVFFIDEKQRVTLQDIGSKEEIRHWARELGAMVHEVQLSSQFRCNGSQAYLNWLDMALQLGGREELDFDFRVVDTPNELRALIEEKNQERNKARLVAGYCWPWPSQHNNDPAIYDIKLPTHDFAMRWNLSIDWIIMPDSIKEVGCIHTCQGLELDYVGVLIGPDFVVRQGRVVTDASKRAKSDRSVFGYKKLIREQPELAIGILDAIIKNTYRTLLTRGMRGCYVHCTDEETQQYLRQKLAQVGS
jgi:DUF2075 family protein